MQRLPPLLATADVRLPISDQSAAELALALLADEPQRRTALVRETLAQSPPLALWAICRAFQRGNPEIHTIDQLAPWLAGVALEELLRPELPSPAPQEDSASDWADAVARALAVAKGAAQIASHARIDPQRAYLLALVHDAPRWLSDAPIDAAACQKMSDQGSTLLPQALQGQLQAIRSARSSQAPLPCSAAECVAFALRILDGAVVAEQPKIGFSLDRQALAAFIELARQDWLRASTPELLPKVIQKLARWKNLEERFQQTLEHEKLESLKELAYGAGHEINNPLANISARAQTLLQDERDPDRRRMLAAINTQAFRAHEMIADMMLFARPPRPKPEPLDLGALVGQLVDELRPQAAQQQSELTFRAPMSPLTIEADKTQIAVAVRALCINALEALVTGGSVEIEVAKSTQDHESAWITVSDNGPGFDSQTRQHIFDPFYSGREAGRGLGFGLSKCWRIVTMHGGKIDVESSPGRGARFTISLPLHAKG